MRKLKFRVWNWAFDGENAIPDVIEIIKGEFLTEGFLPEEAVVEQFTGLLDKNGKEIYEGDILSFVGVLRTLKIELPITVEEKDGYRFMWGEDPLCKSYAIGGEVIGNIHEPGKVSP